MMKKATFGSGCFWCVEAMYQQLEGVQNVRSGYSGGHKENPSYEEVCTGNTGHAEVIHFEYNPDLISFSKLLEVFFKTHDPTTLNRQGEDVGTQYRSVIFYHDEEQRALAEQFKEKLNLSGAFEAPIVTEITAASSFYEAEEYHKNYFKNNPEKAYCRAVVRPKVEKFEQVFKSNLK